MDFAYRKVIMVWKFGNGQKCSNFAHIWCEQIFWWDIFARKIWVKSEHFWPFTNLKILITLPNEKSTSQMFYMFTYKGYIGPGRRHSIKFICSECLRLSSKKLFTLHENCISKPIQFARDSYIHFYVALGILKLKKYPKS